MNNHYVRFGFEGDYITVTPSVAQEMVDSGEWTEYSREDVSMTEADFASMQEA